MTSATRRLLGLAVVIALVGTVTAVGAAAQVRARDRRDLRRAQASVQDAVTARVASLAGRVDQYSDVLVRTSHQRLEARLAAAPRTDFPTAGTLVSSTAGLTNASGKSVSSLSADVRTQPVISAEAIARDSAEPIAVTLAQPTAHLVVVWPLYAAGVPDDVAARRAQSAGWVVGSTPIGSIVGPPLNIIKPLDIVPAMSVQAAGPGDVAAVLDEAIAIRVAHYPHQSRLPVWLIAGVTAAACLTIAAFGLIWRRFDRDEAASEQSLRAQLALLSDISLTVQESLDVGLVLPAALTQIAQAYNLTYIGVTTGPRQEGSGQILSIGRRPSLPGPRWDPGSTSAAPGQIVRLPLQRASRTLGYVELASSHDLTSAALASLRSTTDLVANALHNADLYEREQENVRRLRDIDEMKDDFLATVSHELRTPLSVLVGFMSLLAHKWDRLTEADRREAVVKSQAHVTSLAHLVNDLLDFVSEHRNRQAMPEQVVLDQQVSNVVEQLRPLCERQHLVLHLDDRVMAWTDPRAVERIIGNLVSNAAKYAPAGSNITIDVATQNTTAVVMVTDEGPGISPEEQQRIFERFYRGESDAARSTRGSGIGLAVVYEWLRAVGARLDIASVVGTGTRISVTFPTNPDQELDGAGTVNWVQPAMTNEGAGRNDTA